MDTEDLIKQMRDAAERLESPEYYRSLLGLPVIVSEYLPHGTVQLIVSKDVGRKLDMLRHENDRAKWENIIQGRKKLWGFQDGA